MFTETALHYDRIYSFKDYPAEAEKLKGFIGEIPGPGRPTLLDVACGTGHHIQYLKADFDAQGLDLNDDLLEQARKRNPEIAFHQGDMTDFDLGRTFSVVTCLFSSIGYVKTLDNLARAVTCMANHIAPGGLLVIEPWFTPEDWHPHTVHALLVEEPHLKIARMSTSLVDGSGKLSYFDLHYLIGTVVGTQYFAERHELGLFTVDEMRAALENVGLEVDYDAEGLAGRGLYIGRRPNKWTH
jgi:SAM-dependent methyltransferase